ncbi:hypothetical protein D3C72_2300170 [compost metagenome]
MHVQARPAQRPAGSDGLRDVVFDGRRIRHVLAQVEERGPDAVRVAQPHGGLDRRVHIPAADKTAGQ